MAALTLTLFIFLLRFTTATSHRHLLHQPFFPVESDPPTPSPSSSPHPSPIPKMPFSSASSSSPTPPDNKPFFPSMKPTPPPPSPTALTSFPANISSILFPQPSSTSPHRHVIAIAASVSITAVLIIISAAAFLLYRRRQKLDPTSGDDKASRTDSLRLFPPNTVTSDGVHKQRTTPNRTTENFLYLGTLSNAHATDAQSGQKLVLAGKNGVFYRRGSSVIYSLFSVTCVTCDMN